jgi:hypothetical protein
LGTINFQQRKLHSTRNKQPPQLDRCGWLKSIISEELRRRRAIIVTLSAVVRLVWIGTAENGGTTITGHGRRNDTNSLRKTSESWTI